MSIDGSNTAAIAGCLREFDQYMKTRIQELNERLSIANMAHRDQLKTDRAEAEVIQLNFNRQFARWLS